MRVLALGEHQCYMLTHSHPGISIDFFWTDIGTRKRPQEARLFNFKCLPALRRRIKTGYYDMIICDAPRYPLVRRGVFRTKEYIRAFGKLFSNPQVFGPRLLPRLAKVGQTPVAIVCRSDNPFIGLQNLKLLTIATIFFKRELPVNKFQAFLGLSHKHELMTAVAQDRRLMKLCEKFRPISLGLPLPNPVPWTEFPEKDVDVFFAGRRECHSARDAALIEEILSIPGLKTDILAERLPREEFLKRCAGAWLTWSPQGLGWDCWRHYEACTVGSVPLINYPTIIRHKPLIDHVHAIYYEPEPGGIGRAIRQALPDKAHLMDITKAGRDHVYACHTQEALMKYIIDTTFEMHDSRHPSEET